MKIGQMEKWPYLLLAAEFPVILLAIQRQTRNCGCDAVVPALLLSSRRKKAQTSAARHPRSLFLCSGKERREPRLKESS